ncbi:MAG: helix-turn-helix domain-containing protein [Aigarchaeota archaeon]|nr:helix-turn-helix domain-containing protein [Aigarchaeota archaeon]MCX8193113.1 helix-turn-helix domain-containing protein [Nitrososphaeria archaeon]MDW7986736.1 helix-turn-helix domain-containing protein [Nitrososphaerota archaeon]
MKKIEELKYRLSSVEALIILKKMMSYEQLSSMLDIPPTALSRYVNGHVIPSLETSRAIFNIFKKEYLNKEISRRISVDEFGAVDSSMIIYDPVFLKYVTLSEYEKINVVKVDKVLTLEIDGIPVAYQVASILGRDVAVARKAKKLGVREFIEIKQVFESGAYRYIYLPKNSIKRGEYVLLTDDIIRTGATVRALVNLCKEAKANVSGIFTIIALKKMNAKLQAELNIPVISFIEL